MDSKIEIQLIEELKGKILSNKDRDIEEFIRTFVNQDFTSNQNATAADLSGQQSLEKAQQNLCEQGGIVLAHKLWPIMKDMFVQFESMKISKLFAEVEAEEEDLYEMANCYATLFEQYINDDESVRFQAHNLDLLKNVHIKDAFVLIYYAMLTTKRTRSDNILQLLISGVTSTGKTAFFENPMQEVAHNYSSDDGVGRFRIKKKNTLLLHDVDIHCLLKGNAIL